MIVLEGTNPFGNLAATVEDDGRTVYLYLHHTERRDWGFHALWVRNRQLAPEGEDTEARAARVAPRAPAAVVAHPEGAPALDVARLSFVWLEEGDGVALFEGDDLLAARVVGLAHTGAAAGFARDAKAAWPMAAPLDERAHEVLAPRFANAERTWSRWRNAATWTAERTDVLAHVEGILGPHDVYLATDGGKFPPLAIMQVPAREGLRVHVTAGMGSFPMPRAEAEAGPEAPRRIEIATATRGEAPWPPHVLAWLGRYPWTHYVWLGNGHVVSSPVGQASWFPPERSAVLLVADDAVPASAALPKLASRVDALGETVAYLWAVPLTMDETRFAESHGPAALVARLAPAGRFVADE